jgi:protocatechuate 3,4-dioxygenase, alpha subunit
MTAPVRLVPSGSQTVGPYFHICLQQLISEQEAEQDKGETIELQGKVIDRDGTPVRDAMLEFWGADPSGSYEQSGDSRTELPANYRRVATDGEGNFNFKIAKPGASPVGDGRLQAPHFLVLVFARGLLRPLLTRVYFGDEDQNASDAVLSVVPAGRRQSLVAQATQGGGHRYEWNVVLQGDGETAFFAW